MAHGEKKVELVFIINGANFAVEINVDAPLKEAVARALAESGNTSRPPSEWQVRDSAGVLLEIDRKIKDFGFTNGTRLFQATVGSGRVHRAQNRKTFFRRFSGGRFRPTFCRQFAMLNGCGSFPSYWSLKIEL
jgi:Protein of Unknown function (DUF2604)